MDDRKRRGLVDYVRRNYVDYCRDLWESPAKGFAYSYTALPPHGQDEFLRDLIEQSKQTKLAWDSVSLIAQEHLRAGPGLPPVLRDWVVEVLARRKERPAKGSRATSGRDRMICFAVHSLKNRFELKPTRNDATVDKKPSHMSGCDVVAEAFDENYKTVERAWSNRDPPSVLT